MTHFISRIHRGLLLFNGSLAGLSLISIFLLVAVNAIGRYTLGKSVSWGEDTAIFLMIYGLMFGMAWAYLQDKHIGFNLILRILPERWLKPQSILIDVLVVIIGIGLVISAQEFMATRGDRTSSSTGLPMWLFQAATLIGGVMLCLSGTVMAVHRFIATPETKEDRS